MAQLSEKQLMLAIGLSGLLLSAGSFGGVYWVNGKIEEETVKISGLDKRIAEAERKKARIPKDERDVIILRENVSEYVKILPDEGELTDFVKMVNSFATNSGVLLTSVTPGRDRRNTKSAFSQVTYSLSFTGTLWQFMKFMNSFESYRRFVRVSSFKLTAGRVGSGDAVDDIMHQFGLTLVTYVYNQAAGGGRPVKIVNYQAKRDKLREEIYQERANIRIDRYTFKGPKARRDIFVDPRMSSVDTGDVSNVVPLQEQLRMIETLAKRIVQLGEIYKQAEDTNIILIKFEKRREVKKGIVTLRQRLDELDERNLIGYRPYQLKMQREVVEPLDALALRVDGAMDAGSDGIAMAELVTTRRAMEDALKEGRLSDAIDKFDAIVDNIDYKPGDERHAVANRLRALYHKGKVAQEFSTLKLEVSGVIVMPDGISVAIINGRTYEEGDPVANDLFLKMIREEAIDFLFKDVLISRKR